jgi:putative NIF3 family GTP cyclohydrolase 1 type 2
MNIRPDIFSSSGRCNVKPLSRRRFLTLAGTGLLAQGIARGQGSRLTAGEVVERIKRNVGIPWNNNSYRDTFKIGDPDAPVKGIACTFMSTLDVVQRAKAAGKNMIITHEPTFWNDADLVKDLANGPLYKYKLNYAVKNNLVVWRFHDDWHAMKPDGIYVGWNKALGWEKYLVGSGQPLYNIPPMTLEAVAKHIASSLQSRSVRVIGDPMLVVSKVGRGSHTLEGNMAVFPKVDMILISEAREWDSIEYVRDTILSGQKKGAVIITHEAGEEAGMDHCTNWVRGFVTEVPVEFIPTHDRLWIPV